MLAHLSSLQFKFHLESCQYMLVFYVILFHQLGFVNVLDSYYLIYIQALSSCLQLFMLLYDILFMLYGHYFQVAMFIVLAMVLRRKPDALISQLPIMRENSKYQGQDKLPVIIWMITQVCGICQILKQPYEILQKICIEYQ